MSVSGHFGSSLSFLVLQVYGVDRVLPEVRCVFYMNVVPQSEMCYMNVAPQSEMCYPYEYFIVFFSDLVWLLTGL